MLSPFALPLRASLSRFAPLRTALSEAKRLTVNSAKKLRLNSAKHLLLLLRSKRADLLLRSG
jgi:hypothetical protein